MKVKELIEKLQKFDGDFEVQIEQYDSGIADFDQTTINNVEEENDTVFITSREEGE